MADESLTAVQFGVGPIGARVARSARARGVSFVGAVDVDPGKVGRDLADVADLDGETGATVTDDPAAALAADPDVVFHATVSAAETARPQLETILEAGANVITTCEELVYPWRDHAETAGALDAVARENGVTCLGTGVNPGFVMDALPAVLSTPMERVERIGVERVQDAGSRREPLQRKVGAGTDPDRFDAEVAAGAGHVGSPESAAMLAAAVGWDLDGIAETVEPVIADERVETDHLVVEAGDVAGVHQRTRGTVDGDERVTLDLRMAVGLDSRDAVDFTGDPDVSVTVDGGYHGDVATAAVVANRAPAVAAADPGLATMLDLPLPSFVRSA
ncbi:dihydrodipicolinate reductase [Halobacteriales archaeon QS_1_68_17]|nr:MAG: dihydrodipicolinate reductase [Halobacteriales archaeon QS_1_68_17]